VVEPSFLSGAAAARRAVLWTPVAHERCRRVEESHAADCSVHLADRVDPMSEHPVVRVFLLDDHEVVRRGVRDLLERTDDIKVVGEASTAAEALRRIPIAWPDVAVLDVRLPDGSGIDVCRQLLAQRPELRCLMLTSFDDERALLEAIPAGASGFVLKEVRGGAIVDAIRRIAHGESMIDHEAALRLQERLQGSVPEDPRLSALSAQERRVLRHLADSLTNRQIAAQMYLSEKTVKNYVSHLLLKLDMHGRTEAAVYAARMADQRDARG